jgi:hypothetical protein
VIDTNETHVRTAAAAVSSEKAMAWIIKNKHEIGKSFYDDDL